MVRRKTHPKIACDFFVWIMRQENGVWQADGRSNKPSPGRHSLGTRDYEEALVTLKQLDLVKAVEAGIADPSALTNGVDAELTFDLGVDLYFEHCKRPPVLGGVKPCTLKRYRPVFDKVVPFLEKKGLTAWNQVKKKHCESYAAWLDGESYAYATERFEITAIKTAINWWICEGHLPESCRIHLPMPKQEDTDTYCYKPAEVQAMISLCRSETKLGWLADVIVALGRTGMRISELADLRWKNIDAERNMITLRDESRTRRARNPKAQSTKGGRDRMFPIHSDLKNVIDNLRISNLRGKVFRAARAGELRPDNVRHLLIKHVIDPLKEEFPSEDDDIGFKDGRLHSLRHFFCSECAHSGIPEQVVMKWLGHRQSAMVRRYYHLHDEDGEDRIRTCGGV